MAKSQTIEPFPESIDRVSFGHWLSGLCDGEATFCLSTAKNTLAACGETPRAQFIIKLRDDDEPILRSVQSFLECGTLHRTTRSNDPNPNRKPLMSFNVIKIGDLLRIIVPHFHQFPLRAKKSRDFIIWEKGVEFIANISRRPRRSRPNWKGGLYAKWTQADLDHFHDLRVQLASVRRYPESTHEIKTNDIDFSKDAQMSFGFDV